MIDYKRLGKATLMFFGIVLKATLMFFGIVLALAAAYFIGCFAQRHPLAGAVCLLAAGVGAVFFLCWQACAPSRHAPYTKWQKWQKK